MRKAFTTLLGSLLLIGIIGCGQGEPAKGPSKPSTPEKSAPAPPPPAKPI